MPELDINRLRELCEEDKIKWSAHALKRLRERQISISDFEVCIRTGKIIKQYPDDRPTPSCLILGWLTEAIALHVVVGSDDAFIYAITAYYPDENEWEADMKTRRIK
jgi:hypothetical protein